MVLLQLRCAKTIHKVHVSRSSTEIQTILRRREDRRKRFSEFAAWPSLSLTHGSCECISESIWRTLRKEKCVMQSDPDPARQTSSRGIAHDGLEFEWLLCLAATFQSCQRLSPIQINETQGPSLPSVVAARVREWTLQAWRWMGSKQRNAA